jgi:hypothetical protein
MSGFAVAAISNYMNYRSLSRDCGSWISRGRSRVMQRDIIMRDSDVIAA